MKNQIFSKISQKLKIEKKTLLFVAAGFIGITLIGFSELSGLGKKEENTALSDDYSTVQYCEYIENKLEQIVTSIDGAGKVKVMVTLSETTEYVYATNNDDSRKINDGSENTDNNKDYVIIESNNNDTGLLIKTIEPKIRGVAIVCEGGNEVSVRQQIYSAVSAVLNISTSRISISKLSTEGK